jgi:hypothetical protein
MTNWINTVSRDHVERGVRGRFTQANHGKPHMLKKMAKGDWIVFYSPKKIYPDGEPLQAFTAIGQVVDDEPYQADVTPDFQPWRRNVDFLQCTETPIRPLIEQLDFIEDKSRWGYKFRRHLWGFAVRRCAASARGAAGWPAGDPGATDAATAGAVADRGVVFRRPLRSARRARRHGDGRAAASAHRIANCQLVIQRRGRAS